MSQMTESLTSGTLGQITAAVYRVIVLEILFLATASPGLILLVALSPDPSNAPLVALSLIPAGPAFSAVIFAWRASTGEEHLAPAQSFWRGYRLNAISTLRWWWLVLTVIAILGINVAFLDAVVPPGLPLVLAGAAQGVVFLLAAVAALHAMVINSLYNFRTRDILRLALRLVRSSPRATIGAAAIVIAGAGVVGVGSEIALIAIASIAAALVLQNAQTLTTDIEEKYIA
ncbi:DUF624 domain-containing protein [Arthrobacter citreus]|uniref:DUF624 domain-containing protein n=1 Tax=Arthrobacter TaxID=1663 RepID=UPI0012651EF1|nr:DUF624 domain-containing protein [Arthrobacter gandavensis]